MSIGLAHLVCAGLVVVDLLTRAVRIQWLARGLRRRTRFVDAFTLNVAADAAAALTPLRIGGEPTRLAGLVHAGLSASDTIALITVEGTMEYLSLAGIGAFVGWRYGSEWWHTVRSHLLPAMRHAMPVVAIIIAAGLAIWLILRRLVPALSRHVGGTLRDALRNARRMPTWAIAATFPLTVAHIVARIAVLPVLVATLPSPPPMGAVWVGSVALLYGQLFVPTPSGAGAVELSFLNGAAGDIGPDATRVLIWWRFYTALIGIILGLAFGVPLYCTALGRWHRRRRPRRPTGERAPP